MSCTYELGFGRIVNVNKACDEITILEQASGKFVKFTASRWVVLQLNMAEIDDAIEKSLLSSDFRCRSHLGAGWFCSVSSGYKCVDFRLWFVPIDQHDIKPTKTCLALKLCIWRELKNTIKHVAVDYPRLSTAVTCYQKEDHLRPDIAIACLECSPIPVDILQGTTSTSD